MSKSKITQAKVNVDELSAYYPDILKFIPNLVYWVDVKGCLKGCNNNVRQLLKIADVNTFKKNVCSSIANALELGSKDFKRLQNNNKDVMLTNTSKQNLLFKSNGAKKNSNHYLCDHHPLHNQSGAVIGAVTVIMLADNNLPKQPVSLDHKLNVLIVEDNPLALRATKAIFAKLDCHVDIAESARRAKKLFRPGKYDIAIMDIELEDENGYAITQAFRMLEQGTQHHTPIIALTSHGAEKVKFYCDGEKMDGALTKPLTSTQALQILDKFVFQKDVLVAGLGLGLH